MMRSSSARPVSVHDVEEADGEVFSSQSSGSVEATYDAISRSPLYGHSQWMQQSNKQNSVNVVM